MLALITPGCDVGFHAATPSCATGEHMFDLSKMQMFLHQRLLQAAMLALITPAATRFHAATPSCATGEHMFDLSKRRLSGTAAVWLVPIGSFQGQITYYQLGHPEGACRLEAQVTVTRTSSDRPARTFTILPGR